MFYYIHKPVMAVLIPAKNGPRIKSGSIFWSSWINRPKDSWQCTACYSTINLYIGTEFFHGFMKHLVYGFCKGIGLILENIPTWKILGGGHTTMCGGNIKVNTIIPPNCHNIGCSLMTAVMCLIIAYVIMLIWLFYYC